MDVTASEVRAPRGAQILEIDWSDGTTSRIAHLVLRAFCPCAHCQGHQGPIRWHAQADALASEALELVNLAEVGHYALRLEWGDGHSTGIFRFNYLRELGELNPRADAALRARTFGR